MRRKRRTHFSQTFNKQKTRKQIDRAVTSALAEGYTTLREPATLSNNNGKPFNATLQKAIGKVSLSWRFSFFYDSPCLSRLRNETTHFFEVFSSFNPDFLNHEQDMILTAIGKR